MFSVLDLLVLCHSGFFIFPILFDAFIALPDYTEYARLNAPRRDPMTYALYMTYSTAAVLIFSWAGRRWSLNKAIQHSTRKLGTVRYFLAFVALLPMLYCWLSPDIGSTISYGYLALNRLSHSLELQQHYKYMYALTYLSMLASVTLLSTQKTWGFRSAAYPFLCMLGSSYLNGKRNIVLLCLVFCLVLVWLRRSIRGSRLIAIAVLLAVVYSGYHYAYTITFRPFFANDESRASSVRLDFGRDLDISYAIYHELYDSPVLEYRGQTFLFAAVIWLPREWWPDKPYPYYRYLTSAVRGTAFNDQVWGFTSSYLGESIANAGWFGCLIGIGVFVEIGRLADRCTGLAAKMFGALLGAQLMTTDPSSCVPLAAMWCLAAAAGL
jgi:hypothetical protein